MVHHMICGLCSSLFALFVDMKSSCPESFLFSLWHWAQVCSLVDYLNTYLASWCLWPTSSKVYECPEWYQSFISTSEKSLVDAGTRRVRGSIERRCKIETEAGIHGPMPLLVFLSVMWYLPCSTSTVLGEAYLTVEMSLMMIALNEL